MKGIKKTGDGNPAEDRQAEGPNPLLNYAILAELMSYLPVPDLRHCRLVNSAWRAAATPYLKKYSCLKIRGCHGSKGTVRQSRSRLCYDNYLEGLCFDKRNVNREEELTELGLFGIQNLFANLRKFIRSSSARRILLNFLEDYGASLRNLTVDISDETLELLGSLLTHLPNLASLSINFEWDFNTETVWQVWPSSTLPHGVPSIKRISVLSSYNSFEVRGSIKAMNHYNFLKRLLQIAPNLEGLEFTNSPRVQKPNWNSDDDNDNLLVRYNKQSENLFLRLLKDEGKALCPQLKDLYLSNHLSTWDMKLMLQLDINFRQLLLPHLMESTETIPDVGQFILSLLERHQSSLEGLELRMSSIFYQDTNSSPFTLQFPCFPKLTKLLVEFHVLGKHDFEVIQFNHVDYTAQFPALKDLGLLYKFGECGRNPMRFDERIDFYNRFFPENGQVCPTLQRLTVQVPHPEVESSKSMPAAYLQFIRRLDLMFPNVHNHEEVKACRALDQAGN